MATPTIISRLTSGIGRAITIGMLTAIFLTPGIARKQHLKLKSERKTERRAEKVSPIMGVEVDSLMLEKTRHRVKFRGFDKNASSLKETFYVVNESDINISALSLTIEYFDMSGRMLHRREETITVDIPAGETRLLTLRSIEQQHSLYYHKSRPPRKGGMPFEVVILLDKLYFNE